MINVDSCCIASALLYTTEKLEFFELSACFMYVAGDSRDSSVLWRQIRAEPDWRPLSGTTGGRCSCEVTVILFVLSPTCLHRHAYIFYHLVCQLQKNTELMHEAFHLQPLPALCFELSGTSGQLLG